MDPSECLRSKRLSYDYAVYLPPVRTYRSNLLALPLLATQCFLTNTGLQPKSAASAIFENIMSLEACQILCQQNPDDCDLFHYAGPDLPAANDRNICYLWKSDNPQFKEPSTQMSNTLGAATGCYVATDYEFGK